MKTRDQRRSRLRLRGMFLAMVMIASTVLVGAAAPAGASNGYTQISGLGEFTEGVCTEGPQGPADYFIVLSGDLDGCIYGYTNFFRFQDGSGTYQEDALEIFVGSWGHLEGTFQMHQWFTAKFTEDGQQFGRCQHPIVKGSGTGDFVGIEGRLDFKDDVVAGNAPFRGHLRLSSK